MPKHVDVYDFISVLSKLSSDASSAIYWCKTYKMR